MYFKNLPKEIQDGIVALTTDEEFQKRFATDPILDELDQQKFNKAEQIKLLQILTTKKLTVSNITVKAITPAVWAYLWLIESPFVVQNKQITETDIDIFMYILENGIEQCDPLNSVSKSFGYCESKNIDYGQAAEIIFLLIKLSFKPLCLFPKVYGQKNSLLYDTDWLTSVIAKVHSVTGYNPDTIMNEIPLTAICLYFAQYARINGNEAIYKRSPEELLIAQDQRCCELVVDRLIQTHVMPLKEREKILKHMMTRPIQE